MCLAAASGSIQNNFNISRPVRHGTITNTRPHGECAGESAPNNGGAELVDAGLAQRKLQPPHIVSEREWTITATEQQQQQQQQQQQ
jgi:hypothetical protein